MLYPALFSGFRLGLFVIFRNESNRSVVELFPVERKRLRVVGGTVVALPGDRRGVAVGRRLWR